MIDSFRNLLDIYNWAQVENLILSFNENDFSCVIDNVNNNNVLSIFDFACLLSPVAEKHLELIASISRTRTQLKFGKTIQLYIPLYLSNYCSNACLYCGFNIKNNFKRTILNNDDILKEAQKIKEMQLDHILLVTGENHKIAGIDYIINSVQLINKLFSSISVEIQPFEIDDYILLKQNGVSSIYIYQETYNKERYNYYHPAGEKSDFYYRLNAPERIGESEISKIGLGTLLGLENWRVEAFFLALHLRFLQKKYWKTKYSLSFPRITSQEGGFKPNFNVSERNLAHLIWAFRLFDQDIEIALSTRENQNFRNNMMSLGITTMSAGSKTQPGGYFSNNNELIQFEVIDNRTPAELVKEINRQNYTHIWKDWDFYLGK